MSDTPPRHESCPRQEWANAVSHGAGAVAAAAVLAAMLVVAWGNPSPWARVAAVAHGGSLFVLLSTSMLYHGAAPGRLKDALQTADHIGIYFLIAGSTTPFLLLCVDDWVGTSLLCAQWAMAGVGTLAKLAVGPMRWPLLSVGGYLTMGWSGVFVAEPLAAALPWEGLAWIVAGGVAYTVGVVFYRWTSLAYHHLWWHVAVLIGAGCHAWATLGYALAW